jgi:hypothetical protein
MSQSTTVGEGAALDESGPIEYLIVQFAGDRVPGQAFSRLLELADRDLVRVLDLEFVAKGPDGTVTPADPDEVVVAAGGDLSAFAGASSGLLDADDVARVGELMDPGSLAGIVVYENVWVAAMAAALRAERAQIVSSGLLSLADVDAALADD